MKALRKLRVKHESGLHIRPVTDLVKWLGSYKASVVVTHNNISVNAKSIIGLLSLAAERSAVLTIQAEGEDAHQMVEDLLLHFQDYFEEESHVLT